MIRERDTLRSLASVDGYAGHLAGAQLGIVLVMAGDGRSKRPTTRDGSPSGSCSPPTRTALDPA